MASDRPVLEARSRLDGFNADRERVSCARSSAASSSA
jgi:hypothetical protein